MSREGHICTCLAFDLLIVSEMGFFFSLTALLEKRSTNSPKSTVGSAIFSHTSGSVFLKIEGGLIMIVDDYSAIPCFKE